MTDGPLLAQVLRAAAAGVGLVAATACTVLDDLADRIDPPGLVGDDPWVGFDLESADVPAQRGRL